MAAVQKSLKNVVAIHELPLHFLCHIQLKSAIAFVYNYAELLSSSQFFKN